MKKKNIYIYIHKYVLASQYRYKYLSIIERYRYLYVCLEIYSFLHVSMVQHEIWKEPRKRVHDDLPRVLKLFHSAQYCKSPGAMVASEDLKRYHDLTCARTVQFGEGEKCVTFTPSLPMLPFPFFTECDRFAHTWNSNVSQKGHWHGRLLLP